MAFSYRLFFWVVLLPPVPVSFPFHSDIKHMLLVPSYSLSFNPPPFSFSPFLTLGAIPAFTPAHMQAHVRIQNEVLHTGEITWNFRQARNGSEDGALKPSLKGCGRERERRGRKTVYREEN